MANKNNETATATATEEAGATAIVKRDENEALAVAEETGLSAEFLAELSAEIEADLKSLDVEKLTSATDMLNKAVDLNDAFLMTFTFPNMKAGDDGQRAVFEVTEIETGVSHYVAQDPIGSRLAFVRIFNNARKAQKKLTVTNMIFIEKGKGQFGNKPILLSKTTGTQINFA